MIEAILWGVCLGIGLCAGFVAVGLAVVIAVTAIAWIASRFSE